MIVPIIAPTISFTLPPFTRGLPNGEPYLRFVGVGTFPKLESTSRVDKRLRGADSEASGAGNVGRRRRIDVFKFNARDFGG